MEYSVQAVKKRTINEGSCECNEGNYLNLTSYECIACDDLCKSCDSRECTSCVENAEIREAKCYCKTDYHQSEINSKLCIQETSESEEIDQNNDTNDPEQTSKSPSKSYVELRNSISATVVSVICVISALNFLNMNMSSLWVFLSTLQIFSFSPLLKINLASKIKAIAQGMSLNIIPNIFEKFIKYTSKPTTKRFEEFGYDTTIYLFNNGDLLIILIINTAAYFFLKITYLICIRRDSKILSIISKFLVAYEWSFYLRLLIQGYLDIGVSSLFTLKHFGKSIEIPDYIIAAISAVLYIQAIIFLFPFIVFRFLYRNYELLSTEECLRKWGSLYSDINYKKSKLASYNLVVYLLRRQAYFIAINFLDHIPVIQIGVCYSTSLIVRFI